MPGKHSTNNHQIALKLPHRVWRQVELAAEAEGVTPAKWLRRIITDAVDMIELSADDVELIASRIRAAEMKGKMV